MPASSWEGQREDDLVTICSSFLVLPAEALCTVARSPFGSSFEKVPEFSGNKVSYRNISPFLFLILWSMMHVGMM